MFSIPTELQTKEHTFNGSKFITFMKRVESKLEVEEFLKFFQDKLATHSVYAFRYGQITMQSGFNNDGEIRGVSGDNLAHIIEDSDLNNIIVLVNRYKSGPNLGSVLAEHYTRDFVALNNKITKYILTSGFKVELSFDISDIKTVDQIIASLDTFDVVKEFEPERVIYKMSVNNESMEKLNQDERFYTVESFKIAPIYREVETEAESK